MAQEEEAKFFLFFFFSWGLSSALKGAREGVGGEVPVFGRAGGGRLSPNTQHLREDVLHPRLLEERGDVSHVSD